jgi:hypothetical protein
MNYCEIFNAIFELNDRVSFWLELDTVIAVGLGVPNKESSPYVLKMILFVNERYVKENSDYTNLFVSKYRGAIYHINVEILKTK